MFRICEHIMTTGIRCKSPALRKDVFCYFHTGYRRQQRELADEDTRPPEFIAPRFNQFNEFVGMGPVKPEDIEYARGVMRKPMAIDLGLLEDAAAIQLAISNVLQALAIGRLETRRASVLLYGLQLASNNARLMPPADPIESGTCNPDPTESGIYGRPPEGEGTPTPRLPLAESQASSDKADPS